MPGKVVVIHPDAVNIHRAFVASESDIHWRVLGEVVVRRILNRTGHDAVDVNIHQAIFVLFLHDEAQPDMFIFLELGADFRLFRLESCLLSRNLDSASAAHPICDNRVVIQNVSGAEFDLDCLASTAEVGLERFVADAKSRIARQSQHSHALFIILPTIACEIETSERRGDTSTSPRSGVRLIVATTIAGQIKCQVVRFRFHIHISFRDGQRKSL